MSLIKDYFDKTKRHMDDYGSKTIVLMQVGAFFEVYGLKGVDTDDTINGSEIMEFSRICDLNVVDKKVCCGPNPVVMAGFKDHLLDKYVKKLQDAGFTIAVYEQDEQAPNTTRSLTGIYSPGTYFSTDNDEITNNVSCIWIECKKGYKSNKDKLIVFVGTSIVDIYTGSTTIMEFDEPYIKNPTTFDELERFVSIYNPLETIIISNLSDTDINDIVSFINLRSKTFHFVSLSGSSDQNSSNTKRAINCEKQVYQLQLLQKFYKTPDLQMFRENVYACQSFCYLLDFIYQHNPNLIYKIAEPTLESNSKKLILANHSLKQLNIIDDDNYKGKYSSVSKMLNECFTPMGKRKFTYQFLNPVTDENYLNSEYNIIDHLLEKGEDYKVVKCMLVHIKDISKILRQIMLQKVSPKSLYHLYSSICGSKILYEFILSDENKDLLHYLSRRIGPSFEKIVEQIESIVAFLQDRLMMEDCKEIDNIQKIENSFIKEGINAELDNKIQTLYNSQDELEACRSYFSSLIAKYETVGTKGKKKTADSSEEDPKSFVKIHETEKNNFSLTATDRRCKILEEIIRSNNSKSVVLKYKSTFSKKEAYFTLDLELEYTKQSASNKTISNAQIAALCKNVGTIKIGLIETVNTVYQGIVKELQEFQDRIQLVGDFVTYVDVAYAKAFIAAKYNYCRPHIGGSKSDASYVEADDLRHCLIEKIQQSELYVANSISLNNKEGGAADYLNGILLYGTNAVGKTSFIRALGIAVIMAQAGLFVPASRFLYKPYKYIFTRILGNDNLFKGLSTFAVEMSELRTILRLADKNSLVLGDELCSGTESISAVSIFVAGIQALSKIGCCFIFATHLHEIIGYDEITSLHHVGMKHMSVVYNAEKDCLVYNRKLEDGPGNNMYGLEVCKSLSLPQDFLENAHQIRMKYHPVSASVLDNKGSHFNAKHITGGLCEKCGISPAVDVHHLIFQNEANEKGTIKVEKQGLLFNKNNAANLVNLCQKCHDEIHKTNKKYKKVKTSKGQILQSI